MSGADEIFDVVDADDRVIGAATRDEVHRQGLRHRAAHVLVFDRGGRLYLQRRAPWKECAPGLWDTSVAGHLERGESYAMAAHRELGEELGATAMRELRLLTRLAASVDTGWEFVEVFRADIAQVVRPDPSEIVEGRWRQIAEIENWLAQEPASFTGSFRLLWAKLGSRMR
jgi:isopentenyl-diphosphate delta-isomerase